MRIVFPEARDYAGREDEFFEQMELAVYHARKSWQKIHDKNPDAQIRFRLTEEIALEII